MLQKNIYKNWDVNDIGPELVETKANSKYLIVMKFDKAIKPLVLIMPKMSEYIKIFKDKEGNKKLMYFCIDEKKLFGLRLKI